MKFTLYADTHLYSPIEVLRDEVLTVAADENTLFLGDIIDLSNVSKKQIAEAEATYAMLKAKHGTNYINGNHSRMGIEDQIIVKNNVVFAHGDLQADLAKWTAYRQQPHGASEFKRKFVIPFIAEAEQIKNRTPKQDFLTNASNLAIKNNCKTYVSGHFHPKELIDTSYNGIRIIILPRGKTIIDL